MGRRALIVAAVALSRVALAETEADLAQNGQNLAKDGRYSEAIDAFKAADKLELRASHACLIALAYTRRELWPQAEVWRDTCQRRAKPTDPLPEWFSEMTAQIAERLKTANAAAVEIHVTPPEARLTVSSFSPDETMEPRTIHLPPGHHVIVAKAPGYVDAQVAIDLVDTQPRRVDIELHHPPPPAPNRAGFPLVIAGAALALAGAGTYAWMGYEYKQLDTYDDYNAHIGDYRAAKWITIGTWSAAAACLVTGYILHRRGATEQAPVVSAVPISNGAMVTIGWQR